MTNFYGILSANRTVILSASEESYRQRSKILHFVQDDKTSMILSASEESYRQRSKILHFVQDE